MPKLRNVTNLQPLDGIRVLEMASVISGPMAGQWLLDLGADVIKVELPGHGDILREWDTLSEASSPSFDSLNRGKRSIALDLHKESAREALRELVATADVLIENFRPHFLQTLGLGFDSLSAINASLVYCSIRGLGWENDHPVYDAIAQAKSGLWSQVSDLTKPTSVGPALADLVTGISAASAVLAALVRRRICDEPQHVMVTMLGACLALQENEIAVWMAEGRIAEPSSRSRLSQSYGVLGSDGKALAIHLSSPEKFWFGLTEAIGRPDLYGDERFSTKSARVRNYEELRRILGEVFAKRPRLEWLEALEGAGVPVSPILDISEALEDKDVKALGMLHAFGAAERAMLAVGLPFRGPWQEPTERLPVPRVGEHTVELLRELDFDEEVVASLARDGAI